MTTSGPSCTSCCGPPRPVDRACGGPGRQHTLLYRVARIEKLTGLSLKDQRDRTLVLLAVTWEAIADGVPPAAGEPGDPGF